MNEKALYAALFAIITPAVVATSGMSTVVGKQSYQPRLQGVAVGPCYFLTAISDHRYGFPQRTDVWDELAEAMVHTERQFVETTFQVDALWPQNPSDTTGPTATDLVQRVADIMQSDATVAALKALDLAVYRIETVNRPQFQDDRDQFESSPSLTFVIFHKRETVTVSPTITEYDAAIYDV